MTKPEVIQLLRNEVKINPAVDAVMHLWASRDRARVQVTVAALEYAMKREGFKYDRQDYTNLLGFLAKLELGILETDSRGRIVALKKVHTTLQSIGKAAVQEGATLETFKRRNRYSKLLVDKLPIKPPTKILGADTAVSIAVRLGNKVLQIPIPESFDRSEIADLIARFQPGASV